MDEAVLKNKMDEAVLKASFLPTLRYAVVSMVELLFACKAWGDDDDDDDDEDHCKN